jgi:excisionase family DNA binding protein
MSSNIRINRICEYCGIEFEAKTTVTRFCTTKCNSRAGKLRIKQLKMGMSEQQTIAVKVKHGVDLSVKEFLTVKDASKLLNCSKHTIYGLIRNETIKAVNLGVQKTRIRKSEIDKIFDQPQVIPLISNIKTIPLKLKDCYSIGEAEKVTGLSNKTLYVTIKRHNISKFKQGKFVYVPKADINKLANLILKTTIS